MDELIQDRVAQKEEASIDFLDFQAKIFDLRDNVWVRELLAENSTPKVLRLIKNIRNILNGYLVLEIENEWVAFHKDLFAKYDFLVEKELKKNLKMDTQTQSRVKAKIFLALLSIKDLRKTSDLTMFELPAEKNESTPPISEEY